MREEVQFALSSFCTKIATTISKLCHISVDCPLNISNFSLFSISQFTTQSCNPLIFSLQLLSRPFATIEAKLG